MAQGSPVSGRRSRQRAGMVEIAGSLSSFVGRRAELAQVRRLLSSTRILTLGGAGGSGKTRLAGQVARAVAVDQADGVCVAEFARVQDPAHVPAAILAALGVGETPGDDQLGAAARQIGDQPVLLVLDNCEHVAAAAADAAHALLLECPRLRVLATSRESPLGVPGETIWRVPGMSLHVDNGICDVASSDAVQLFIDRAREAVGALELDDQTLAAIVRICRDLDGMPLAIELAAARMRMMSASQIAAGLADRFHLLTSRRARPDQTTLRASIDWSYELLTDAQRVLLRRLSVFAGGFSLRDVEAICSDTDIESSAVLDVLAALVDKSLVDLERRVDEVRYRLLEVIRHYAAQRLVESGEAELIERRHWRHFRALAAEADVLRLKPEGRRRLEAEQPNLRIALDRSASSDPGSALAITAGLSRWWLERDLYSEGRASCARALAAAVDHEDPGLRSIVHWGEGMFALYQGDVDGMSRAAEQATHYGEIAADPYLLARVTRLTAGALAILCPSRSVEQADRAVAFARHTGDPIELAVATATLGNALSSVDDYSGARAAAIRSTELVGSHEDPVVTAWCWWVLCMVEMLEGNPGASAALARRIQALLAGAFPALGGMALAQLVYCEALQGRAADALGEGEEALRGMMPVAAASLRPSLSLAHLALGHLEEAAATGEPATRSGFTYHEGRAFEVLGRVALAAGNSKDALAYAEQLEQRGRAGTPRFHAQAIYVRGRAALLAGELGEANALLHRALRIHVELGASLLVVETLEALAACARDAVARIRLLAAAGSERARRHVVRLPHEESWLDDRLPSAREELSAERFDVASGEGSGLSLSSAVAYAQRSRGPRRSSATGWEALTPTERQVAELAAAGRSNPEIAADLFISRGTVKVHLSRAYAKLGIESRTHLARLAAAERVL